MEETLLLPQTDFSLGTDAGTEEGDNPNGTSTDNASSHSPENPCEYHQANILHDS